MCNSPEKQSPSPPTSKGRKPSLFNRISKTLMGDNVSTNCAVSIGIGPGLDSISPESNIFLLNPQYWHVVSFNTPFALPLVTIAKFVCTVKRVLSAYKF